MFAEILQQQDLILKINENPKVDHWLNEWVND